MTALHYIRLHDTMISLAATNKIVLEENNSRTLVFVKDKADPFIFIEPTKESATSFYIHLCNVIKESQKDVPFLIIATVALRLDLLTSIHLDGSSIVLSSVGQSPDLFGFPSNEEAKRNFDDLMITLGISAPAPQQPIQPEKPAKEKTVSRKPPDKVPRKSRRR